MQYRVLVCLGTLAMLCAPALGQSNPDSGLAVQSPSTDCLLGIRTPVTPDNSPQTLPNGVTITVSSGSVDVSCRTTPDGPAFALNVRPGTTATIGSPGDDLTMTTVTVKGNSTITVNGDGGTVGVVGDGSAVTVNGTPLLSHVPRGRVHVDGERRPRNGEAHRR